MLISSWPLPQPSVTFRAFALVSSPASATETVYMFLRFVMAVEFVRMNMLEDIYKPLGKAGKGFTQTAQIRIQVGSSVFLAEYDG